MKIEEIEIDERPREKLINNGPSALSNIELLAIMLCSGTKDESVLDLSARLINEYGFDRLFSMNYYELREIKGIKDAKATRLMALFEIARRVRNIDSRKSSELKTSQDVYLYLKDKYQFIKSEVIRVLFVNKQCEVIKEKSYTSDSVSECLIPFRLIVNEAINLKAFGIFISHNHPSGDLTPSISDIKATKTLLNVLKPLGIHLFDHLIIGNSSYYSFADERTLANYD